MKIQSKPPSPFQPVPLPSESQIQKYNLRQLKKHHLGQYQLEYYIFQYTFKTTVTEEEKDDFNEELLTHYDIDPHAIILFCSYDGVTVDGLIAKGKNRPELAMRLKTMKDEDIESVMNWLKEQDSIKSVKSTDSLDYYYGNSSWRAVFESWVASGDYKMIYNNL